MSGKLLIIVCVAFFGAGFISCYLWQEFRYSKLSSQEQVERDRLTKEKTDAENFILELQKDNIVLREEKKVWGEKEREDSVRGEKFRVVIRYIKETHPKSYYDSVWSKRFNYKLQ